MLNNIDDLILDTPPKSDYSMKYLYRCSDDTNNIYYEENVVKEAIALIKGFVLAHEQLLQDYKDIPNYEDDDNFITAAFIIVRRLNTIENILNKLSPDYYKYICDRVMI